jgi:hypothetical protein
MSQPYLPPSLREGPSYVPPVKVPFWTRTKVGVGAGILGLVVGIAGASGGDSPAAPATKSDPMSAAQTVDDSVVEEAVDAAVADARDRMDARLEVQRAASADRLARARRHAGSAQRLAVRRAVATARAQERARTAAAVAAATAATAPSLAGTGGDTDPRFNYCYEAVAAGYGPYFQGQDPEYGWYEDADNDGSVCE